MQQVNPPYVPQRREAPTAQPAPQSAPQPAPQAQPQSGPHLTVNRPVLSAPAPAAGQKLRLAHGHPAHPQAAEAARAALNRPVRPEAPPPHHAPAPAQPFVSLPPQAGTEADAAHHPHRGLGAQLAADPHLHPQPGPRLAAPPRLAAAAPQAPAAMAPRLARPGAARPGASRAGGTRRDPAPSRLAYRLQRLWLTPVVRALTRIGVPVFALVLGLGAWLGDGERRADLLGRLTEIRERIEHQPAFMVSLMKIEGASPEVDAAIRAMAPVALPASSFDIDLQAYRRLIARLDAVADVRLVIRKGGTLEIAVTERAPAILWRTHAGIEMLDATGHRVATLTARDVRADLPLISGEGADAAVPEALAILRVAGPLLGRIRGLERMGERRWDVVLDRDQRLMLPETNPVRALDRTLALDSAEDLLARDFTHLDLRNPERPTLRLSARALDEFRQITAEVTKVTQ